VAYILLTGSLFFFFLVILLPPRRIGRLRYLFEDYALDTDRRELYRATDVIVVTPQVFDLLDYLIRNRDRVVTKDDLLSAIWNGRIVSMKFVATKTAEQLDLQALHRVRERLVSQRTGIINQIRAFMLERGIAVRQGIGFLRKNCPPSLRRAPMPCRHACCVS